MSHRIGLHLRQADDPLPVEGATARTIFVCMRRDTLDEQGFHEGELASREFTAVFRVCEHCPYRDGTTPSTYGKLLGGARLGTPPGMARYPTQEPDGDDWGCPHWIHAKMKAVAAALQEAHLGQARLIYNDISKAGGGKWDHINHQNGLDVDVAYLKADGTRASTYATSAGYDKNATGELVQAFLNDSTVGKVIVNQYADLYVNGAPLQDSRITPVPDHVDHFHVGFANPDKKEDKP